MGGAADFPERASSPLKRRASSIEPETEAQNANEDVDMVTVPSSDAASTNSPMTLPQSSSNINGVSELMTSLQEHALSTETDNSIATTNTSSGTSKKFSIQI
jgi:ubiquitin carboxyl-terminal hydrolase 4/11